MLGVIGWILWGLVALYIIAVLLPDFVAGGPDLRGESVRRGRLLVGTQGLVMLAGLVITATLPVSKYHLLWVVPVAFYLVPFTPVSPRFWLERLMRRKVEAMRALLDAQM